MNNILILAIVVATIAIATQSREPRWRHTLLANPVERPGRARWHRPARADARLASPAAPDGDASRLLPRPRPLPIVRPLHQAASADQPRRGDEAIDRWTPHGMSGPAHETVAMTTCRLTGPGGIDIALDPRSSPVHVGRDRDATVMLPDSVVSTRHARLEFRQGTWWLADEGSRNGTWVDDHPVAPERDRPVALADGSRIRFGRTGPELTFHRRDIDPTDPPGFRGA